MKVLIANVGSTSLKYKLFNMQDETILLQGGIERIGQGPGAAFRVAPGHEREETQQETADYLQAIQSLRDALDWAGQPLANVAAVGFKVVHARGYTGTVLLDEPVLDAMREYIPVAPAHNPPYIQAIEAFRAAVPTTPLVGLFETAFHQSMPDYAYSYALPPEVVQKYGLRKYGFHGASHRYVSERMAQILGRTSGFRLITCHLGGSSSLCAVHDGKSIATSMGFSPQSGVPQTARIGDIDAFALLYLMEKENWSVEQARRFLCKECGLKGLSGTSGDMRDIEAALAEGNDAARLARQHFIYEVKTTIGTYAAALGGLDALAFTGGMGEKGVQIREAICFGLQFLGLRMGVALNRAAVGKESRISSLDSKVAVWVVPTNEEIIVAREAVRLLA